MPDPDFTKYAEMRNAGHTANEAYLVARADGLGIRDRFHMLAKVYRLSLREAKEVRVTADGTYASLEEYHEKLIPILEEALRMQRLRDARKKTDA